MDEFILALDVSTSCIGIALFKDRGDHGDLQSLTHLSPKIKPIPETKLQELFEKSNLFSNEFLIKYKEFNITKIIIEEPLLGSNNVYTVATLLRFNGMVAKACYDILNIVPEFISSHDARKFGFPELMEIRKINKKGEIIPENKLKNAKPTLFGGYSYNIDKKEIIFNKVATREPQIVWLYDKYKKIKKENYDQTDAYCAGLGYMQMIGKWKIKTI